MVERGVEVGVVTNGGWKMHLGRGLNVISASIRLDLDVYNVYNGLNVISVYIRPYLLFEHSFGVLVSTCGTRQVSFREESRMVGQSLIWEFLAF